MKKYILGITTAAVVLAGASFAFAEIYSNGNVGVQVTEPALTAKVVASNKQPMVVEIGAAGRALLRGTISAVGTNSLTVKSWGGEWIINIPSSAQVLPVRDMAQFKVGDFVGVQGVASTSVAWTIDATLIRNWTERKVVQDTRKDIKNIMKSVMPRNWEGVVTGDVNADGRLFKLMVGDVTYDVTVVANAKVVNNGYGALDFSSIKSGDTVRVYGPAADTTITASVVRDVSVKASYDLKANVR